MAIETVQIHTNPYAPQGADAVSLYNTDLAEGLTFGQLMAAVCIRAGAVLEAQSVAKMNVIGSNNSDISRLSEILQALAEGTVQDWGAVRAELIGFGIDDSGLPAAVSSYDERMQAMKAVKNALDLRTQSAQEDMIDLQTLINRRDVAFTTSTNMLRALGQSGTNMAGRLL